MLRKRMHTLEDRVRLSTSAWHFTFECPFLLSVKQQEKRRCSHSSAPGFSLSSQRGSRLPNRPFRCKNVLHILQQTHYLDPNYNGVSIVFTWTDTKLLTSLPSNQMRWSTERPLRGTDIMNFIYWNGEVRQNNRCSLAPVPCVHIVPYEAFRPSSALSNTSTVYSNTIITLSDKT